MCIEQLPSPVEAQKNRIPKIYTPRLADFSSEELVKQTEIM